MDKIDGLTEQLPYPLINIILHHKHNPKDLWIITKKPLLFDPSTQQLNIHKYLLSKISTNPDNSSPNQEDPELNPNNP